MEQNIPAYRLVRSDRRTLAIQITPAGEVVVRCPRQMPKAQADRIVRQKAGWIMAHLPDPREPKFSREELAELAKRAKEVLPRRAARFAPMVGVDYGRITIRCQRTRWGSCSSLGNLNFNCLLMLAPPEVADYVVVHELCHRKEMNHSAAFWAEVEKILPDYQNRRAWLREHGSALMARLPE